MANSFVLKSLKSEHVGADEQHICHPFFKVERHFIPINKIYIILPWEEGLLLVPHNTSLSHLPEPAASNSWFVSHYYLPTYSLSNIFVKLLLLRHINYDHSRL